MLQIYVAWYQFFSSHPTSCIAVCWRLDDPDPFLQGPPIPQGGAGYHCSICILNLSYFPLRYLIWSSFQYLILTYILVTHFSIHVSLAWNQVSSSYSTSCQLHCCRLELDDPHPFPGPTHFRGGRGLMSYDHDHGRGGGGGSRNLEHIYYIYKCSSKSYPKTSNEIIKVYHKSNLIAFSVNGILPKYIINYQSQACMWANGSPTLTLEAM